MNTPSENFVHELRGALNHLYDPDYLRGSPMAVLLGVNGRFDTPSALQNLLTRSIESLKPGPDHPNKPHAQAIYDLLMYRYVQQFNQDEIAHQLGISVRHLRRQQNLAIYELACHIWEQHQLKPGINDGTNIDFRTVNPNPEPDDKSKTMPISSPTDRFTEELVWLKQPASQLATDLSLALEAARVLIYPLAEKANTQLIFPLQPSGLVQVHPVAFQQILLGLLTYAIQHSIDMEIQLTTSINQGWLSLSVKSSAPQQQTGDTTTLETVRKIVEICEGTFEFDTSPVGLSAQVTFRSVDPTNVLVIDDNPDLITMMGRFAAETRFRIIGLSDPNEAIEYAQKQAPDLIVLDIMMPQIDGLQVLSRIKHHPHLGNIPVIICSVLPQKDLAAALGASGFIQKPIQRDAFIDALTTAVTF